SENAPRRGTVDRAARNRAPARPYHLHGRFALRRHCVPAIHLHDARAGDGAFDLLPTARATGGLAAAHRAACAGTRAPSGGERLTHWRQDTSKRPLRFRARPEPSAPAKRYPPMPTRLIHVDDSLPGISRERWRGGWRYRDAKGRPIRDKDEIARLDAIALPPA